MLSTRVCRIRFHYEVVRNLMLMQIKYFIRVIINGEFWCEIYEISPLILLFLKFLLSFSSFSVLYTWWFAIESIFPVLIVCQFNMSVFANLYLMLLLKKFHIWWSVTALAELFSMKTLIFSFFRTIWFKVLNYNQFISPNKM